MLIHHFGAKKQGFQGLVDQNDHQESRGPRKMTFSERNIFEGVPASAIIIGWLVGGCGARAVSCRTPIFLIVLTPESVNFSKS